MAGARGVAEFDVLIEENMGNTVSKYLAMRHPESRELALLYTRQLDHS